MRKIGRNDPCPCGSGKKYKKCCLPLDEESKIIRLKQESAPNEISDDRTISEDDVRLLIEDRLFWDVPVYQQIARDVTAFADQSYSWEDIAGMVLTWHAYSQIEQPVVRKKEVYLAAVEYGYAVIAQRWDVTQKMLADKYGASVSSISKKADEIVTVAREVFLDESEDDFEMEGLDEEELERLLEILEDVPVAKRAKLPSMLRKMKKNPRF